MQSVIERLVAIGMSEDEAARKAPLYQRAIDAVNDLEPGATRDVDVFWIPGRIEFLGKHTDYAGGRSLLCAVERGICMVAVPRHDRWFRVRDARSGETVEARVDVEETPVPGHWSNYPITVARRIARNFAPPLVGADIAFVSDIPIAAGMSSSSALVVGVFLALADANDLSQRAEYRHNIHGREALAGYLGCVENGLTFGDLEADSGVGTFGGSEDHTAILCGRHDSLVQYSFCPVRYERTVPLPQSYAFVIATSGIVAEKSAGALEKYNAVSWKAQSIAKRWCEARATSHIPLGDLVANPAGAVAVRDWLEQEATRDAGAEPLRERLEQFVIESTAIIPAAGDALERGDPSRLGELVDESMHNATAMLHNQVPETVHLAAKARELGAHAASAFGAGFGGSVWALVSRDDAERIRRAWQADYVARFPEHAARAEFFITRAGPAAGKL